MPDLVICSIGTYWRVPVVLSSRSLGRLGVVGTIDVDVETGNLLLTDKIISRIEDHAERLAIGAAV